MLDYTKEEAFGADERGVEVFLRVNYTDEKDKSEPHHCVMRFGFLLSPPDILLGIIHWD